SALAHLDTDDPSHAFSLGTGTGLSVKEIVEGIARISGTPVPHELAPRRLGDPASLVCGSAKAHRLLGWEPTRSTIDQIVTDALAWHQGPGYKS
ncbi:MAG: UDP-glucose 4-epimerase GalE, partial [Pseudomonadota bacterium]